MAEQDKIIGCLTPPVEWRTMFKLLGLKDSDDNTAINVYYSEQANCDNFEAAYDCLIDLSFEEVLRLLLVEDKCGRPSINLIGVICAGCPQQIQ